MNRLVIIGNGFDLAHGLKTKYEDFINDYLGTIFSCAFDSNMKKYKDDLISISNIPNTFSEFNKSEFIESIQQGIKSQNPLIGRTFVALNFNYSDFQFTIRSEFFGNVLLNSVNNWVDFENSYYQFLLKLFKDEDDINKKLRRLNDDFSIIEKELETYLCSNNSIEQSNFKFNYFRNEMKRFLIMKNFESIGNSYSDSNPFIDGNLCLLNFNYTKTIEQYLDQLNIPLLNLNIHGELKNNKNPIVFGYGDYHHEDYSKLENANNLGLMIKMKAMFYPKTDNQKKLFHFLDFGQINSYDEPKFKNFEVVILGHSCGLSDRNLLRTIFEHPNCTKILIAYFENPEDHFNKTIEISRHFHKKEDMLKKLEPFNEKLKIPQLIDFKS